MKVSVIGAGAWGTTLGLVAHRAGHDVTLWMRDEAALMSVNTHHQHPGLPGLFLPHDIEATQDLPRAVQADLLILSVSAAATRDMAKLLRPHLSPETQIMCVAKGIEVETGALMTQILEEELPGQPTSVLSGPNFATEIAHNLPAAAVLACSMEQWDFLQGVLSTPRFRPYHSLDIIGVQLGGAMKNVVAIACGLLKSQDLGENAMAALITRSLAEIRRIGISMGAQPQTFSGLSGVGDLMLTCLGTKSRNLQFGEGIGKNPQLKEELVHHLKTVEGLLTTRSMMTLAEKYHVELPICETVYKVLYENTHIMTAIETLLMRPLKSETDKIH